MSDQLEVTSWAVFLEDKSVGLKRQSHVHVDVDEKGVKCSCDEFVYRKGHMICPHMLYVMKNTSMMVKGKTMQHLIMGHN